MSSLRNAVNRKTHKERAQPAARARLGLLEKRKDYLLRAKDFHKKEQTIQVLKEKAARRNPDEFYFDMIRSRTVDGVHRPQSDAKKYTHEELRLMKTQDIKYVLNKAQAEKKKVESIRSVLHLTSQAPCNTHLYFAEGRDEARQLRPALASEPVGAGKESRLPKRIWKKRESAYRELTARTERVEKFRSMMSTMTLEKELMGKGRKRKLTDAELANPGAETVYKWRQERKT